ncbi:unnamed protein product [Parnassius mnemosyne]|uniref:WAP domain-containing protein n=1 Tax=Parnassius mnemosyne TaxID=213953 RepID=A0AAV1LUH3_9NEOP
MFRFYLVCFLSITVSLCQDGSCPPTLSVDVCDAECGPQRPSNSSQLCCPTTCVGSLCVDPMTRRHFVNYIKQGSCPKDPKGPWLCTHTCTTDSDCVRALKCCPNRCGVFTCQMPRFQDTDKTA